MAKAENPKAVAGDNTKIDNGQVRAYIERIERLQDEKDVIGQDIRELFVEAKSNGYDVKILRKLIAIRKQGLDVYREEQALIDLYGKAGGVFA